jgi:2-dehydro-3-deoxygluconokinase
LIRWLETDSISGKVRNGLYFWERGFGRRTPVGCSDRANTAVSQLAAGDIDWDEIFRVEGTRWFHTGGIFAALSGSTAGVAEEALARAHESGSLVSYDLNFRQSLWAHRGGRAAADELNQRLLQHVDVVFGTLNFDASLETFDERKFADAAGTMMRDYPQLKAVCTTLRTVHNASLHDLSAALFDGTKVYLGPTFRNVNVLDRVGSGDAFAAGLIFEFLSGGVPEKAIALGASASVLAMTTPGDSLAVTSKEVIELADAKQNSHR